MAQAEIIVQALKLKFPALTVEILPIKTTGDKALDSPLSQIGSKALFTKEIEEALLSENIDLAVHSLKDMTSDLPDGLAIGAVLKREDPHDCLISKEGWDILALPKESKVGTSSLRRKSQILHLRPDILCQDLRGNVDTRVRKLEEGAYQAILVAQAGLNRLAGILSLEKKGLKAEAVPIEEMLPAVGQGCLAIEIRSDDKKTRGMIEILDHASAHKAAICERAFLRVLEGDCQVPIGAFAEVEEDTIFLQGLVASLDGRQMIRDIHSGPKESPQQVGEDLAKRILSAGGAVILEAIRA